MTTPQTTTQYSADLTADDFGKIRSMVRQSLLCKGLEVTQVNELMTAYRTMQPIFSSATKFYKEQNEENKKAAYEARDKAVAYLKNEYSSEDPFLN